MKTHKPLILLVAVVCTLPALAQVTIYYNRSWRDTTRAAAWFLRTRVKKDSLWQVADYYHSGSLSMTGAFADEAFHRPEGEFVWYDDNGVVFRRRGYSHGKADGPDLYLYPEGKPQVKGQYSNNKRTGEWLGYYPDGKLSGKAVYDTGRQVSMIAYNEDGSENGAINKFFQDAEYPGGQKEYMKFLNENLHYPNRAARRKIEGTVVIRFKVSKEGKVSDITVDQSVEETLDKEAIRVIEMMPDWRPAVRGGAPIDTSPMQPVVFKIP